MVILLMGVSGVGKTTIGQALAQRLHWPFVDADDYHSAANVAKMHSGIALTDADRAPWLRALREAIENWSAQRCSVVLACSALKEAYRRELLVSPEVKLVFLHADPSVVSDHLAERNGHFMNPRLMESQFETLEPPVNAISMDTLRPVAEIVASICSELGLTTSQTP